MDGQADRQTNGQIDRRALLEERTAKIDPILESRST
jgi:hypothetical protein